MANDDDDGSSGTSMDPATSILQRLKAGDVSLTEISLHKSAGAEISFADLASALHENTNDRSKNKQRQILSFRIADVGSLGDAETSLLCAISSLPALQSLSLQNVGLSASSARQLQLQPTLQYLRLQGNPKLGPRGLRVSPKHSRNAAI
jgi:hypothetical protein